MNSDYGKRDRLSDELTMLNIINRCRKITRRQIAEHTGFSQGKISLLIGELRKRDLITEEEEIESSGGRRAKLLQIGGNKGYIAGLEIGGYETKLCVLDLGGKVVSQQKMATPQDIVNPEKTIEVLTDFIQCSLQKAGLDRGAVKGLGIAFSGVVDRTNGACVYFRNQKSWEGLPLLSMFQKASGLPCTLDDSSRMAAVAEKVFGSCTDADNFVVISIGVGTGCGIYINGELFRGKHGYGGELGHMVIKENGPRCVCGNYGCLESFVSGYAIERRLREALAENVYSSMMGLELITAKEVVEHAERGDKLAYSIITEAARHLGIGVANIINIFNPMRVVLSGGVARGAGRLLLEPASQVVRGSALGFSGGRCELILSRLDEYAACRGAAHNWLDEMLADRCAFELTLA
jgi:N-acetylglucosamine repressor